MSTQETNAVGAQMGQISDEKFSSPEEEIAFLRQKLAETQTEFLEFQESSRELETEYETQVKQLESKNNKLSGQLNKLEIENDQLKSKYNFLSNDTQHKLHDYQEQLAELQALNTRLTSYIRELEQNNDDLERARRALAASLGDFEVQLNQQIERNVLLENEVSEKAELECVVQRLKEEARDLKHELIVHSKQTDSARRKQLSIENHLASPKSTDLPVQPGSLTEEPASVVDIIDDNGLAVSPSTFPSTASQQTQATPKQANGSVQARPLTVDSTTSPPQTPTAFPFTSETPDSAKLTDPPTPKSTESKSQQTSAEPSPTRPAMGLTPSSRISALNIVSDLLRKVVSLESKLSTAKKVTN